METTPQQKDNKISLSKFSFIFLLIFLLILLGIVFFLFYKWQQSDTIITNLEQSVNLLQKDKLNLEQEVTKLSAGSGGKEEIKAMLNNIDQVLRKEKVLLLNEGVDVDEVASVFSQLPPGKKKTVLSTAMLLSLRKYRFRLGGRSPAYGFDSPEYARYVLQFAGKDIPNEKNKYLSEIMMSKLEKTTDPQPGDLMFFEGAPGNIALFYLTNNNSKGKGIGIGFLGKKFPGGIYNTSQIDTKFLGYYRVNYGS
ncbi:MAG: NlpC/P60 family protein [Bacteroidota bacterium]